MSWPYRALFLPSPCCVPRFFNPFSFPFAIAEFRQELFFCLTRSLCASCSLPEFLKLALIEQKHNAVDERSSVIGSTLQSSDADALHLLGILRFRNSLLQELRLAATPHQYFGHENFLCQMHDFLEGNLAVYEQRCVLNSRSIPPQAVHKTVEGHCDSVVVICGIRSMYCVH